MSFTSTKIDTSDKNKFYNLLIQQAEALLYGEKNPIANAANLSSLLYHSLECVNWVGFYLLQEGELVLGPFQGQVACTRIPLGQGVCGTALYENKTLRIEDVNAFKGHIACDSASQSELVVPIKGFGVLDIDSPQIARFDEIDQAACEEIAEIFRKSIK